LLAEVGIASGASAKNREAIQITGMYPNRGIEKDSAISISTSPGGATWEHGIYFNNINGTDTLDATSNVLTIQAGHTVNNVINMNGVTCAKIIVTDAVSLSDSGFTHIATNASVNLGEVGASNSPRINFRTGAAAAPIYDSQIIASGGSGADKGGSLTLNAGAVVFGGDARPGSDNLYNNGVASFRWSVIYAGTGTINTSDAVEKQQVRVLSSAEHAAAVALKGLVRAFKFNDAVALKGAGARIHVGVIAQDVVAAFAAQGLDASDYGLLCYDEWVEAPEVVDGDGNVVQEYRAAGNRYGIRYEELLAFIIAAM